MITLVITGDLHGNALFDKLPYPKALLNTNQPFDINIKINKFGWSAFFQQNGLTIDIKNIGAVYIRRPVTSNTETLPKYALDFVAREIQEIVAFICSYTCYKNDGMLFCQGKQFNLSANKIIQLIVASELGIEIPETIITNIPVIAERFYDEMDGNIIYKCLSVPILEYQDGKRSMIHTSRVPNREFSNVSNCPCLFQKNIDKAYELRLAVVGDQIIGVSINSQILDITKQDWRKGMYEKQIYSTSNIPHKVKIDQIRFHESLKLEWGMVDMIVTPNRDHIFIETNPDGAWLWLEEIIPSIEITELLAKHIFGKIQKKFIS